MTEKLARVIVGLTLLLGVLVTAFAWPATNSEPNDVPIAVAGPGPVVDEVSGRLESAQPGAFDVLAVVDEAAARAAIEDRDVYGAIVADPSGAPEVLIASAASPVVAQLLQQVAEAMAAGADGPSGPAVTDVVPLPEDDPRGVGLIAGALPLVIGGIAVGVAMSLVITGVGRRIAGAAIVSATSGLLNAALLQYWLGSLQGNYWANAAAIALVVAAMSFTMIGLHAVMGRAGLALGAAIMLLLGNPLSGLTSAPEMLPEGWGALGQLLPPGAGGSLLRSTAFFDGAGAGTPLLVLTAWIAFGLVLAAIGSLTGATRSRDESPVRG
ncbi:MAG: hypothetical protein ACRD08_17200, partial [Acidimicrobiales bacterium]